MLGSYSSGLDKDTIKHYLTKGQLFIVSYIVKWNGSDPCLTLSWSNALKGQINSIIWIKCSNKGSVTSQPCFVRAKQKLDRIVNWAIGWQEFKD
jgi:hypothetical protein